MEIVRKIFRVVVITDDEVSWISSKFFATEAQAVEDIWSRATDDEKYHSYRIEKCSLCPGNYFEINEATTPTFIKVHMIANVIDDKSGKSATYGIAEYELI